MGGDLEALVDRPGVVAELREREPVLVDEALELSVAAVPGDADEVHFAGPPLCGRLDRGGFRLQITQYGAQNQKATVFPA